MADGLHAKVTNFDDKIVSMKLMTADRRIVELITKIVASTPTSKWVMNPQLLQAMVIENPTTKKQEEGVGMVNFMVTGDQGQPVEIQNHCIMATSLASKTAAEEYNRINSSLITAKTPGLVV